MGIGCQMQNDSNSQLRQPEPNRLFLRISAGDKTKPSEHIIILPQ
jgi:hypothetical protein